MRHIIEGAGFSIAVDSDFISDFQWAVHAVVAYRSAVAVDVPKEIEIEAQLELMLAITRACQNASIRGARSVVVLVEGDRELAGLFQGVLRALDTPRLDTRRPRNHIEPAGRQRTPPGGRNDWIRRCPRNEPRA